MSTILVQRRSASLKISFKCHLAYVKCHAELLGILSQISKGAYVHVGVWRGVIPIRDVYGNAHQRELHHGGEGNAVTWSRGVPDREMSVHLFSGDWARALETFTQAQCSCSSVGCERDALSCSARCPWKRLCQHWTLASRLAAGRLLYDPLRRFPRDHGSIMLYMLVQLWTLSRVSADLARVCGISLSLCINARFLRD